MIIRVLTRIFLIPIRGRRTFEISATVVGIIGAAIASRMQNNSIERVHRQIEMLQGPQATPEAIVAETRNNPFSIYLRMMHFVVRLAPVMTGMSPQQMLRYVIMGLIRHGYSYTVDNVPGYMNREQSRRAGIAPHPEIAYQINSPRNVFNTDVLDRVDAVENRTFANSADIVTVHADSKVVIVLSTIVLYARVLLIFLIAREIFLAVGKYLASRNIVVIDSKSLPRKRRVIKSSSVSKKE